MDIGGCATVYHIEDILIEKEPASSILDIRNRCKSDQLPIRVKYRQKKLSWETTYLYLTVIHHTCHVNLTWILLVMCQHLLFANDQVAITQTAKLLIICDQELREYRKLDLKNKFSKNRIHGHGSWGLYIDRIRMNKIDNLTYLSSSKIMTDLLCENHEERVSTGREVIGMIKWATARVTKRMFLLKM